MLIVQLFTGWTVTEKAVAKSPLVGAALFIQTFDEMDLIVNTIFDLAEIIALFLQARKALLASLGF